MRRLGAFDASISLSFIFIKPILCIDSEDKMRKWEYRTESAELGFIDNIKELGETGWELVCVTLIPVEVLNGTVYRYDPVAYFKREK